MIVCALLLACGSDPPPALPSDAVPAPAAVAKVDPAPPIDASPIDAHEWWRAHALGQIDAIRDDGDRTIGTLREGTATRPVAIATSDLADATVRDSAYRNAIAELVLAIRTDRDRSGARERLEDLTKTDRGPWENWLSWHDDNGDYLVYNEALARVDIDEPRKAARTPETVHGLQLHARLGTDRIRPGDPLKIDVRLVNASADPIVVNQRFAFGHELRVELSVHETNAATAIALREPEALGPPPTSELATLAAGGALQAGLDLTPKLLAPLEPGHYALRVTYVSEADTAGAWIGAAPSVRSFVRVVPW